MSWSDWWRWGRVEFNVPAMQLGSGDHVRVDLNVEDDQGQRLPHGCDRIRAQLRCQVCMKAFSMDLTRTGTGDFVSETLTVEPCCKGAAVEFIDVGPAPDPKTTYGVTVLEPAAEPAANEVSGDAYARAAPASGPSTIEHNRLAVQAALDAPPPWALTFGQRRGDPWERWRRFLAAELEAAHMQRPPQRLRLEEVVEADVAWRIDGCARCGQRGGEATLVEGRGWTCTRCAR